MKIFNLIIAAGEAKRFGFPKQILKWGDSTILGTVINEALSSGFDEIFVVLGAHYEKISEYLQNDLTSANIVKNENWQQGMFSSVKAGLLEVKKKNPDYVLIQLGDMPFITSRILKKFINAGRKNPDTVIAVENNRPAHPYMFHKKFIDEIISSEFKDGMRSFVKREFPNAIKIEVDTMAARQDIDTWDTYNKLTSNDKKMLQI